MDMNCAWCGERFALRNAEYNRIIKTGRQYFFCTISHAAKYRNAHSPRRRRPIIKVCPNCDKEFETMTGAGGVTFCSRSCASKGSVTEKRREAARKAGLANIKNLHTAEARAASLRSREWWRYNDLATVLDAIGELFTFEFPVKANGDVFYVFDLALHNRKLLVEFDGKYHQQPKQQQKDIQRDQVAQQQGWKVLRVLVPEGHPVPIGVVKDILR